MQALSGGGSSAVAGVSGELARRALIDAFIARGTHIPFSTPALHQARLRVDASGHLEALLPAFSGADGIYVVPFRTLPSVATLTVHDRALFSAIVERNARSPDSLHAAAFDVARKGLAGARAAETAAKALAQEQQETALTKAWLIAATINQAAPDESPGTIAPAALLEPGARGKARAMLKPFAPTIEASVEDVLERLEDWGGLIAAVGIADMGRTARLRRLAVAVAELANQIGRWSEGEESHDSEVARELAVLAAELVMTCCGFFQRLDELALRTAGTLRAWRSKRAEIAMLANSASWVLDGWDFHVLSWRDAADHSRADQVEAIREIRALFPRNLAHVFQPPVDTAPDMPGRKSVRLNQGWRPGAGDGELRRRLERLKERSL